MAAHTASGIKDFKPFPKNPAISKIFREIGYVDELGSGMINTGRLKMTIPDKPKSGKQKYVKA